MCCLHVWSLLWGILVLFSKNIFLTKKNHCGALFKLKLYTVLKFESVCYLLFGEGLPQPIMADDSHLVGIKQAESVASPTLWQVGVGIVRK